VSGREVFDDGVLVIATAIAAIGVGGLIVDKLRASRAEGGRRRSADLGWILLRTIGLGVCSRWLGVTTLT